MADEIIITNEGRIEQIGTPLEIYQNPKTAFVASFFGQISVIKNYRNFNNFDYDYDVKKAIVRPEFVKVTKKDEVEKFKSSASEGIVEHVSFRGDNIEICIRINNEILVAKRRLEEKSIEVGEKVDVFLYKIFVIDGEKVYLLENKSLQNDSIFI